MLYGMLLVHISSENEFNTVRCQTYYIQPCTLNKVTRRVWGITFCLWVQVSLELEGVRLFSIASNLVSTCTTRLATELSLELSLELIY